jgi:hypothetical protein
MALEAMIIMVMITMAVTNYRGKYANLCAVIGPDVHSGTSLLSSLLRLIVQ